MSVTKVTSTDFVESAQYIYRTYQVDYKNGYNGYKTSTGRYWCDCRGYILWSLRRMSLSVSSAGTNWMIRNQMSSYFDCTNDASKLIPGMVVFKAKPDAGDMPSRYKKGGSAYDERFGELDVYHIGIVIQTVPSLIIRHCSSGGLRTDTSIGKWCYAGWVQWVDGNNVSATTTIVANTSKYAIVAAESGKTVNLRKSMSTKSALVERIPIGSKVQIVEQTNGWTKIKYRKWSGYMMTGYLKEA